jgi:uncharacterized protein YgiM (DUF1202 family)
MKKIFILLTVILFLSNCTQNNEEHLYKDKYLVTSKKGINLRELPEKKGKVIYLIPSNEKVTIIKETKKQDIIDGISSPWYFINYKSYSGWVFGGYLKNVNEITKIQISKSGIGPIKIGDSFESIVNFIKPDDVKINNDGKEKVLVWADIYSDIFELPGEIHVGSSIDELLAQYPCKKIDYDEIVGEGCFSIVNYNEFNKAFGSLYVFVKSNDKNKPIITDDTTEYIEKGETTKFHKNGKVDFIYIHK